MTAGINNHALGINNRAIVVGPGANQPALKITQTSIPDMVSGSPYSADLSATGAIGQGGRSTTPVWSATGLPAGLSIDPATGIIAGTSTVAAGNYPIFVTVADGTHVPTTVGYMLVVTSTSSTPSITTSSLPDAQIGVPYNATLVGAGGQTPYTWSAVDTTGGGSNAFPTGGLLINPSTGKITGTPSGTGGTRTIVVSISDSNAVVASRTFSLVVAAAAVAITTTSLPDATNGQSYSKQMAASGGSGTKVWSATGLPSGLSISNGGLISGTPNDTAGDFTHVQITVAATSTDTQTFTLTLADQGTVTTPPAFVAHKLGIVIPPRTGFNTSHLSTLMTAQADLSLIRNQLNWYDAQPTKGVDPDFTNGKLSAFNARLDCGLDNLILVMDPPGWARPSGSGQHAYPIDPDDFGYFCGKAAAYIKAQHPTMRQRWEIFNEPNNAIFTDNDPASAAQVLKYAKCLQAAYKAIHAVAPNALVGTGGTAPASQKLPARKSYNWIASMMDALKAEHTAGNYTKPASGWHPWAAFDRVSHHPYSSGRNPDGSVGDSSTKATYNAFAYEVPLIAAAVLTKTGAAVPLWQTEYGINHSHHATVGVGWPGGPYTDIMTDGTGREENTQILAEPEAYAVMNKAIGQWFGDQPWPSGSPLPAWPAGYLTATTRTELFCYFHMGPDNFLNDRAQAADGFWDSTDTLKRVTGSNNDAYEAFTGYAVT